MSSRNGFRSFFWVKPIVQIALSIPRRRVCGKGRCLLVPLILYLHPASEIKKDLMDNLKHLWIIRWHHDGIVVGGGLLFSHPEPSSHRRGRISEDELGSLHLLSSGRQLARLRTVSPGHHRNARSPRQTRAGISSALCSPHSQPYEVFTLCWRMRYLKDWVIKASPEHWTGFTVHKLGLYCSYLIA